jgi:undecaprenyl pyrophosphate synthase
MCDVETRVRRALCLFAIRLIDVLIESSWWAGIYKGLAKVLFPVLYVLFPGESGSWCRIAGKRDLHIGFVMDGNRRYARNENIPLKAGHADGYRTMKNLCQSLRELGVRRVTFFAFGKKNYTRTKEEVKDLMDLIAEKSWDLKKMEDKGCEVRIIGDKSSIDSRVRDAMNVSFWEQEPRAERENILYVNVLVAYSSIEEYLLGGDDGLPEMDVDLIVRTGGEKRLSDFLLASVSKGAHLAFVGVMWPLFTEYHLLWILLRYSLERSLLALKGRRSI